MANLLYLFIYERQKKEKTGTADLRFDSQTDCTADTKIRRKQAGRKGASVAAQIEI